MQTVKRSILWFRQDLRIHDNEALVEAIRSSDEVIPVYVFDPRVFLGKTRWFGFQKTGKFRANFILESVAELRQTLRDLGTELYIRIGKPEEEIFEIANTCKSNWVFCNRERTKEEVEVQDALEQKLWTIGQEVRYSRGKMLYYTSDLPFPVTHAPDHFTNFRKEVERYIAVRPTIPAPESLAPLSTRLDSGQLPKLIDLGHSETVLDSSFRGGEKAGLARLKYYFWESDLVSNYKETRNGMLGIDYSTKFSPWLALGCLSPKMICQELKAYEEAKGANDSTYGIFLDLLWRDFFRLMGKKHGDRIFLKGGIIDTPDEALKDDWSSLKIWMEGRTGLPFIDANIRELNQTGFMSNRGRQNVASFLIKDLNVNWQMGAEYFESMLIDYDVTSNWGNWIFIAGVGNDNREDRYFNILSQARKYDPKGEYVKNWIPELSNLPSENIHRPDVLTEAEQKEFKVVLGDQYPKPVVDTRRWV